jgi:hypothetical protein
VLMDCLSPRSSWSACSRWPAVYRENLVQESEWTSRILKVLRRNVLGSLTSDGMPRVPYLSSQYIVLIRYSCCMLSAYWYHRCPILSLTWEWWYQNFKSVW